MTLDQSLANLQHQADRLANLFGATADAIEARTGSQPLSVSVTPEMARAVADGFAVRPDAYGPPPAMPERPADFWDAPTAPAVQASPPAFTREQLQASFDAAMASGEAPSGVVPNDSPMLNQTPQGASPSSAPTAVPPASAAEVEGPGVGAPETPRPAGPTAEAPPWNEDAPGAAPGQPEKKSGRRSNEEIAAEIGVDLDAVKKWKGGGRISRKDMEEFKRLNPDAVVAPQVAPFAQPAAEPMPTQASSPFGSTPPTGATAPAAATAPASAPSEPYNQGGMLPAAAPAQGAPQEWPVAQPVAAQPQQGEQFGEWQQAAASDSQWDPFKA